MVVIFVMATDYFYSSRVFLIDYTGQLLTERHKGCGYIMRKFSIWDYKFVYV